MSKMGIKCEVTGATSLILTKVQNVAFVPEGRVFHWKTSLTEIRHQMRSGDLFVYLFPY